MIISQPRPTTPLSGVFEYIEPVQTAPGDVPYGSVGIVGLSTRGPFGVPRRVLSKPDFEAQFGPEAYDPTNPGAPLSGHVSARAVLAQRAGAVYVVRGRSATAATAYVTLKDAGGAAILSFHAGSPGTWPAGLMLTPSANAANPALTDLTIVNPGTGETDVVMGLDFSNNAAVIAAITAQSALGMAAQPMLDIPAAPTVQAGAGGTLPAGLYSLILTRTSATGETTGSPEVIAVSVPANGQLTLTPPPAAGELGLKAYLIQANAPRGGETYAATGVPGQPLVISAPWPLSTETPPTRNTATIGPGSTNPPPLTSVVFPTTRGAGVGVGDDGAGATATRLVGSDTGDGPSGLHAFAAMAQPPNVVILAEDASSDPAAWEAQAQLALANAWYTPLSIPRGMPADQVAAFTQGAGTPALKAALEGGYVTLEYIGLYENNPDPLTGLPLLIAPATLTAGLAAAQEPHESAAYRPASGVAAPERAVSDATVAALAAIPVNVFTAHKLGLIRRKDLTLGPNPTGSGRAAHLRMVNLSVRLLDTIGATYTEHADTDDLRANLVADVLTGLGRWARAGYIPDNTSGSALTPTADQLSQQAAASTTTASTKKKTAAATAATTASSAATAPAATPALPNYWAICDGTVQINAAPGQLICLVGVTLWDIAEQVIFWISPTIGQAGLLGTSSTAGASLA